MSDSPTPESLAGTRYARIGGMLFGVFLIVWAFVGTHRWDGHTGRWEPFAKAEPVFFFFFGALLLLPWRRLGQSRHWGKLYALVCFFAVAFAFVMICEVMALNYIADDAGLKAKTPIFQGIELFFALGQIPTLLFFRRPELLD